MAKRQSSNNKQPTTQSFVRNIFVIWLVLVLLTLVGLGVFNVKQTYEPEGVFKGMIENSFRTSSVTRTVLQQGDSQKATQITEAHVGGQHIVHGRTVLEQGTTPPTIIETETLGTPSADYVRYADIQTEQQSTAGGPLDFSSVLGVWGKSPASSATSGELYTESVLSSVIPVGNLSKAARNRLMAHVDNNRVYDVNFNTVARRKENGRSVYVYKVAVQPEAYIALLRQFGIEAGITQLETLNPASYKDSNPLEFEVTVDVLSKHLTKVSYSNGRVETFSSYGVVKSPRVPKQTVTVEELQSRIQNVQ